MRWWPVTRRSGKAVLQSLRKQAGAEQNDLYIWPLNATMDSVLFLSLMNGAPWGGSEEVWFQTALYAAKNNYKVGCAFFDWPQKREQIEQLRKAGCTVYLFSNRGREKETFAQRMRYKLTKRQVRWRAKSLPFHSYDITVINLGYLEITSPYWKSFYRRIKNYALLFHVYNQDDRFRPSKKALLKQWILSANHNLFASDRIKEFLEKELSVKIPNGNTLINPITFAPPEGLPPYPPLQAGNVVFIMLATLEVRRKAQDNLIKALSEQKWKDRPWQLWLYGGGESEAPLKNLINANGLQSKVILKGHTADVKAALSEAHLLLQMTHIDAMPLAVIEALAMAKPVCVSDVGDMPKWVTENVNGWISATASVEDIDATLEKAWQERERWEAMGKSSYQLFKERFPVIPEKYFLEQLKK